MLCAATNGGQNIFCNTTNATYSMQYARITGEELRGVIDDR
jgi:hypothetical protein